MYYSSPIEWFRPQTMVLQLDDPKGNRHTLLTTVISPTQTIKVEDPKKSKYPLTDMFRGRANMSTFNEGQQTHRSFFDLSKTRSPEVYIDMKSTPTKATSSYLETFQREFSTAKKITSATPTQELSGYHDIFEQQFSTVKKIADAPITEYIAYYDDSEEEEELSLVKKNSSTPTEEYSDYFDDFEVEFSTAEKYIDTPIPEHMGYYDDSEEEELGTAKKNNSTIIVEDYDTSEEEEEKFSTARQVRYTPVEESSAYYESREVFSTERTVKFSRVYENVPYRHETSWEQRSKMGQMDGGMDEKEVHHHPAEEEKGGCDDKWLRRNPDYTYRPRRRNPTNELETPCVRALRARTERESSSAATVIRRPAAGYEDGPIPVEGPASTVDGEKEVVEEEEGGRVVHHHHHHHIHHHHYYHVRSRQCKARRHRRHRASFQ